jgi:hypothetical protein
MNDLNSVVLGGTVHGDVRLDSGAAWFTIVSRHDVDGESIGEAYSIVASGKLGGKCYDELKHGRGIRIVGKLRGADGQMMIEAEHVELKPARRSGS